MKEVKKITLKIKNEDYFLIEKTLESLSNNNNAETLKPMLDTMQDNLRDKFNKEHVETDVVFLKDIYILFRKLINEINKESVNQSKNILKNYLLSYPMEKNDSYNMALEMSFYDQGYYDNHKGVDQIDYPILVDQESISSWLAGWNDYQNKN